MSELKTDLANNVFGFKYANYPGQTWTQNAWDIVNDVTQGYMNSDEQRRLHRYISERKSIPGGRYVYYAGKPAKFYNNCGTWDTKLLTDEGWVMFSDKEGEGVNVLSPVDGEFYPAIVYEHGEQDVYRFTFAPVRGRSGARWTLDFTEDHKWLLTNGETTTELREGDVVPANCFSLDNSDVGFAHGFVFGDGNVNGKLRLCAEKDLAHLGRLSKVADSVKYPKFAKGDPCLYFKRGNFGKWKELPETNDPGYVASFIMGWLAADSCQNRMLNSVSRENLEWFVEHAPMAGLVISGEIRKIVRDTSIGGYEYNDHVIYQVHFSTGGKWEGFKVVGKDYIGKQPVYCPYEPVHNQIVVDYGIHTFNCLLMKGEEDTREEWANLMFRSTSALMSGAGIGIDYSVFRGEGSYLFRTGGEASGPIPLMEAINETGRNVKQGGSRRSAIYGSLNWQHSDVPQFLVKKNWHNMKIPGTDRTLWDAKQDDFDFPAPLDMTNISLNYDNQFLEEIYDMPFEELVDIYQQGGKQAIFELPVKKIPDTFMQNCRQALSTAEPGFSFNFFEKVTETLRNACTEVTSEDDSDVCNLASINLGAIDTIEELRDVVNLTSKFLVCGTLEADLPYDKVYEIREKNRRLGLGLMGMHEWLLKRGYPYEVVPELHEWLGVYQDESESGTNDLCDELNLNYPVAYRAIAPTGTIGILASTTSGIEPLFAVAYKRRYLQGNTWKYEYVVDNTAKTMIDEYGIDPNDIETASSLAKEPERRIKFQADVQDYVDQAISSTINLPSWGSEYNNENRLEEFAFTLAKYAVRLRGFTCYPDGARGGQPITEVDYYEALNHQGTVFEENQESQCRSGICGI